MRNACLLSFLLIFTFLHGCSAVWVKQDYDESVDFLQFTTFDWAEPEQPAAAAKLKPPVQQRYDNKSAPRPKTDPARLSRQHGQLPRHRFEPVLLHIGIV